MKVKMLTGMAGANFSHAPGDIHECDDDEAIRLIEAGAAVPHEEKATEKSVKKGPDEVR